MLDVRFTFNIFEEISVKNNKAIYVRMMTFTFKSACEKWIIC